MRIRLKKIPWGTKRIKKAYLFIPKSIDGEVRWLEWATWEDMMTSVSWGALRWMGNDN